MTDLRALPILSIDAWRDPEGWTWNNWHRVGTIDRGTMAELCDDRGYPRPRAVLRYMRDTGYLTPQSAGRCRVGDDAYNVVITDRRTGEPLLAIEYGNVDAPPCDAERVAAAVAGYIAWTHPIEPAPVRHRNQHGTAFVYPDGSRGYVARGSACYRVTRYA